MNIDLSIKEIKMSIKNNYRKTFYFTISQEQEYQLSKMAKYYCIKRNDFLEKIIKEAYEKYQIEINK